MRSQAASPPASRPEPRPGASGCASVTSTVTGEIDVRGVLGVDPDVRKGFSSISVEFDIDADADDDQVDALIASATKYSAVFDMLTSPTLVTVGRADA